MSKLNYPNQILFQNLEEYINDNLIIEDGEPYNKLIINKSISPDTMSRSLEDIDSEIDETFTERLLRLIDQKDVTDTYIYKRANIDRRHFSKIRSNSHYNPSKHTVISLAMALKLSEDETEDLLNSAGYSLSRSFIFDLIIMYCIEHTIYDIDIINEALHQYGEKTLGNSTK